VPLHPAGTLLWHDVELLEIRSLAEWVRDQGRLEAGELVLPQQAEQQEVLRRLLCHHEADASSIRISRRLAVPLLR
ncbi:MAG: hypothetical protein ACPGQL_11405, partial [Thermoplasmatota archaeon]